MDVWGILEGIIWIYISLLTLHECLVWGDEEEDFLYISTAS